LDTESDWNQKHDLDTDKGRTAPLTKEELLATYDQFLERLHRLFPHAEVIASIGPIYDE